MRIWRVMLTFCNAICSSYIQPNDHVALINRFNKKKAAISDMAHIGALTLALL